MRILLIRLRQVGDVVFTTPAIRAIRGRYPDAHLTYVVEPVAAAVVANHPLLNEIIVAPLVPGFAGLRADIALGRRLRRDAYDIVIDFHGGGRAAFLTWLTRAPVRIGYAQNLRTGVYTQRVPRPPKLGSRHSVENQWDLIAPLGVPPPSPQQFPLEMTVDPDAVRTVDPRLAACGVVSGDRLIVMHVSAGGRFRRWPLESFAEVAATLASRSARVRILVTSGPSEADAADRVIAMARARLDPADRQRVLVCGEFSLAELRAIVDRAALFLGGDSGPMHIAAASAVPMVSLYGPTLPARSAPWRSSSFASAAVEIYGLPCRPCLQRVCAPGDFRCLTRISPAQVVEAAEQLLA